MQFEIAGILPRCFFASFRGERGGGKAQSARLGGRGYFGCHANERMEWMGSELIGRGKGQKNGKNGRVKAQLLRG